MISAGTRQGQHPLRCPHPEHSEVPLTSLPCALRLKIVPLLPTVSPDHNLKRSRGFAALLAGHDGRDME